MRPYILNPLNLDKIVRDRIISTKVIPLLFIVTPTNEIIVTHNLSENRNIKTGDEITHINNIASRTIIDSLLTVSRSDGNNSLGKKLVNICETPDEIDSYSLFDIFFTLFFPQQGEDISVRIKPIESDIPDEYYLNKISYDERIKVFKSKYGTLQIGKDSWDYKILNSNTAYMKFGTFSFWNSDFNTTRFIDSIFNDLNTRKNVTNLIVDIRNNEGGDNTGDYILSYLTKTDIGGDDPDRPCYRYLTIPDSLKPFLDTWDNNFKNDKDSSLFFVNELGLYEKINNDTSKDYIIPKENRFTGKVFLLINSKNSSAGYEMARNFKTYNLGTIVGQITGGTQQGINGGEFFFLKLPNSGFEIDLPLIFNYHPNKLDSGISPDYEVEISQKDIFENIDSPLDFTLKLINK